MDKPGSTVKVGFYFHIFKTAWKSIIAGYAERWSNDHAAATISTVTCMRGMVGLKTWLWKSLFHRFLHEIFDSDGGCMIFNFA